MGVSIKYVSEKRRRSALRKAIWYAIERELDQELDISAANEVVSQLCDAVKTVAEDMKSVMEFNRIGYKKRHWYSLELHISQDRVTSQNILEEADSLPSLSHKGHSTGKYSIDFISILRAITSCIWI